jgi:transketolase
LRNVFIHELVLAARSGKNVALIVGDLGYKVVEPFADEFPDRFWNAGIAEQNMMGMAAGLASEGVHVFCYSIANFPTFRCAEQIRNDVAYHNLPVTIVAVGGGLAYGSLGYSHHAIQDYALIRTMPNMLIASPGDPMEVRGCMNYLISNPGPSYLRLGKAGEESHHEIVPEIYPGEWNCLELYSQSSERTILTTGASLEIAINFLREKKISNVSINTLPLWGMSCKSNQAKQVSKWVEVITMEDHLIDGGFSSWMLEALSGSKNELIKIIPKSIDPKVCGTVGSQKALNTLGGLYDLF